MAHINHDLIADTLALRILADTGNADFIAKVDTLVDDIIEGRVEDLGLLWEDVPKIDESDVPRSATLRAWANAVWLEELFTAINAPTNVEYEKKMKLYHYKAKNLRASVTKETILKESELSLSNRREAIPMY